MARNGSGTYSNPYPNFVSGTVISSSEVDANNSDIATALTQSIAVDGQSVVTASIPLAANKLTGVAVGSAATDSLNLGQAQAEAFIWCGTASGSADAITLAPSPAITAYAAGQRFVWMASGSVNTGATTVAISGLSAIALQDNGAALVAGNHAAGKMFMGILNTTSTVQIMQVQISGTDPLLITSLTVSGTSLLTGVTTHGDDVVSDTDSTDDLGTTSVRWANLFVDGITATDEITAATITAETAVVPDASDGATLGSATLEWADAYFADGAVIYFGDDQEISLAHTHDVGLTVNGALDVTGDVTGSTVNADGDTAASDNAAMGYTAAEGLILTGQGSTSDVTIKNDADADVIKIPTGTTNVTIVGDLTVNGVIFDDETLDIYDEGTWSPILRPYSVVFDSITYDSFRYGSYVIIGHLCHFEWAMRTDAITVGSGSGGMNIAGLPVAPLELANFYRAYKVYSIAAFAGEWPAQFSIHSSSLMGALDYNADLTTAWSATAIADLDTGADKNWCTCVGTYETA
jgi:hypothetical protein